jgi:hypothetical protein
MSGLLVEIAQIGIDLLCAKLVSPYGLDTADECLFAVIAISDHVTEVT